MKKRITALALALTMVLGIAAAAAGTEKSISVTPMGMTINGQAVTPTKSDGTPAEVFAYDGATYVPLRYLSELLGIKVEWDENDPNTAKLVMDQMTYTSQAQGMNGKITVKVTVADGKIAAIDCSDNMETAGVGKYALDVVSKRILDKQTVGVDGVTGATISSTALKNAVKDCLTQAGLTAASFTAAAPEEKDVKSSYTADVIIVGGGGAGLSAATAASKEGASVIVVEKTGFLGGNSIVAGGIYNCADPDLQASVEMTDANRAEIEAALAEKPTGDFHAKLQAELKKEYEAYKASKSTALFDSPAWHALQTWIGGDRVGDLEVIYGMTSKALDGLKWLEDMGLEVQPRIGQGAGSLYNRTHYTYNAKMPNTTGIIAAFTRTLEERDNVSFVMNTTAESLVTKNGAVTGVKATTKDGTAVTFTAKKGVIIATGGFAGNVEMRQQYCEGEKWPDLGSSLISTNMPAVTGDGIRMAEAVGANLVDMDQIQLLHTTNPIIGTTGDACMPKSTSGAIFVNQDGNRFWREDGRRDDLSLAAKEQNERGKFWVIENSIAIPDPDTTLTTDGRSVTFMVENGISEYYSADTLDELAEKIGVNAENLKASVAQYNAAVDAGKDEAFGRTLLTYKFEEGPWYAFSRAPSAHHTMGGIQINTDAEVLNTSGKVIKGLYAAGEVCGGIHGGNRLGGNAIVDFVVYGRVAGTNAAKNK